MKLKLCPFCGRDGEYANDNNSLVCCHNNECPLSGTYMVPEDWNHRAGNKEGGKDEAGKPAKED